MKLKIYNCLIVLLLGLSSIAQQQSLYTNILNNQYLYNPAFAGVTKGTQVNLGYRNQYVGFDGAPKNYYLTGYGTLKKQPMMSVGGMIQVDRIGLLQRTSFYGSYTYQLKINKKSSISFGLSLGGIQYNVKNYDAKPYDKDDVFLTSQILNAFAFDANSGFYYHNKNLFIGGSIQQMPNTKIRWNDKKGTLTNHFYAYIGYDFKTDTARTWVIQPSILGRISSPAPYQLEYNLKLIYKDMIWIGGGYRERSSSYFLLGVSIKKQYTIAYSYDFTMTDLNKYSSGSHEIMLAYHTPFKKKKTAAELARDADENELNTIDNSLKTNLRGKKKKQSTETPNKDKPKTEEIKTEEKPNLEQKPEENKPLENSTDDNKSLQTTTETPTSTLETEKPVEQKTETPNSTIEKPIENIEKSTTDETKINPSELQIPTETKIKPNGLKSEKIKQYQKPSKQSSAKEKPAEK
jgi:type IX secretion system PorP/SprF family membrane protein